MTNWFFTDIDDPATVYQVTADLHSEAWDMVLEASGIDESRLQTLFSAPRVVRIEPASMQTVVKLDKGGAPRKRKG